MTRKLEFVMDGESDTDKSRLKSDQLRVITNFDDLRQLKPRCRLPVDISSEQDHLTQPPKFVGKKYFSFLQTNKSFLNKITDSMSSTTTSSGYSSSSSSPSTSPCYQENLLIADNNEKKATTKSENKIKVKGRHSIGACHAKPVKILTVLFDYESKGKEILGNKVVFRVKKGDLVKVIRDYDKDFHLVAKCADNNIGFLPKDYTVDLVEVKNKVLKNSLFVSKSSAVQTTNRLSKSNRLSFGCKNNDTNRNYENSNNPLFKLTKL